MNKKVLVLCVFMLCLVFSAPAWAAKALVGSYFFDEEDTIRVVIKDKATIRASILEEDDEIFFLLSEGKRSVVGRNDTDSPWEVIDLDAAIKMMLEEEDNLVKDLSARAQITKMGAQKINGFKGEAFTVKYPDEYGDFEEFVIVVSDNKDVVAISDALKTFLGDIEEDEIKMVIYTMARLSKENGKNYGLLKYDDELELKSITKENYADDYFKLPADAVFLDLDGLM